MSIDRFLAVASKYRTMGLDAPKDAPRVRTRDGLHIYLSAEGIVPNRVKMLSATAEKQAGDVRGDGGHVMALPSAHPEGGTVRVAAPDDIAREPSRAHDLLLGRVVAPVRVPVAETPAVEEPRPPLGLPGCEPLAGAIEGMLALGRALQATATLLRLHGAIEREERAAK